MEQRKDVHFEIQRENDRGHWTELYEERPTTEQQMLELCARARAGHPGENIRAVKVTTLVTVEDIPQPAPGTAEDDQCPGRPEPVYELLQDCD